MNAARIDEVPEDVLGCRYHEPTPVSARFYAAFDHATATYLADLRASRTNMPGQLLPCWTAWPALAGQLELNVLGRRVRAAPATCRTAGRYRAREPIAVTEVAMATRTTITLEDDINGGPAQETLRFRLGAANARLT